MADGFETNIVHTVYPLNDTDNLYGVVRNVAGQVRDVVDSAWDAWPGAGDLDHYDISFGTASGGLWKGNFPNLAACAVGFYIYQIRVGAKALTDKVIASAKGYWNGSVFARVEADASGRVKLMPAGLDDVSKVEPVGYPTNFREFQMWQAMRFVNEHVYDKAAHTLKVKKADDTLSTTQTATIVGDVETVEKVV